MLDKLLISFVVDLFSHFLYSLQCYHHGRIATIIGKTCSSKAGFFFLILLPTRGQYFKILLHWNAIRNSRMQPQCSRNAAVMQLQCKQACTVILTYITPWLPKTVSEFFFELVRFFLIQLNLKSTYFLNSVE
jgi:hypothetical protein